MICREKKELILVRKRNLKYHSRYLGTVSVVSKILTAFKEAEDSITRLVTHLKRVPKEYRHCGVLIALVMH